MSPEPPSLQDAGYSAGGCLMLVCTLKIPFLHLARYTDRSLLTGTLDPIHP